MNLADVPKVHGRISYTFGEKEAKVDSRGGAFYPPPLS